MITRPLRGHGPVSQPSPTRPAKPGDGPTFELGEATAPQPSAPARPSLVPAELPRTIESLETRRQEIDELIKRSLKGEGLSAQQLLVWQARVYDYSQRMELFSKVVDRSVAAVKTTLNTQV